MAYCTGCGKKIKETSKFCSGCGHKFKIIEEPNGEKEKINSKQEENNTFECEYCGKNFTNETAYLRHEKNCSERSIKHEIIHHAPQQKSNARVVIVVIIIIVIAAIILMNMYGQQQHASSFAGQTESLIDKIFG